MHLAVNPEEEDPEEDPMDDEEHPEAEEKRVPERESVQLVPRGARLIVISTQLRIIRTAIVPRGRPRDDGASLSRAPLMTFGDRSAIRE